MIHGKNLEKNCQRFLIWYFVSFALSSFKIKPTLFVSYNFSRPDIRIWIVSLSLVLNLSKVYFGSLMDIFLSLSGRVPPDSIKSIVSSKVSSPSTSSSLSSFSLSFLRSAVKIKKYYETNLSHNSCTWKNMTNVRCLPEVGGEDEEIHKKMLEKRVWQI